MPNTTSNSSLNPSEKAKTPKTGVDRRGFLARALAIGGAAVSYATFGGFALRFLYPDTTGEKRRMYLASISSLPKGKAVVVSTPSGKRVVVLNTADGIRAFSTICPHLGCQVHWEDENNHFFCPCHSAVFDPTGKAMEGPPASDGKDMLAVEIALEGDGVFAWV